MIKGQSTESAVENHYVSSLLPFQNIPRLKEVVKTKEFYKPEQCIWSNPHRTSKRLYPYFHQFNDDYVKNVKPKIESLIENDRKNEEKERILRLTEERNETRRKFHSRQQNREILESKADSRRRFSKNELDPLDLKAKSKTLTLKSSTTQKKYDYSFSLTKQSYDKGLNCFDEKAEKIRSLFTEQISKNCKKIRNEFQSQKQSNEIFNSRSKGKTLLSTEMKTIC